MVDHNCTIGPAITEPGICTVLTGREQDGPFELAQVEYLIIRQSRIPSSRMRDTSQLFRSTSTMAYHMFSSPTREATVLLSNTDSLKEM